MPSSNLEGMQAFAVAKDNGYSIQSLSTNTNALLETPFILFKNSNALQKLMRVIRFHGSGNGLSNVQSTIMRIYLNPTITANGAVIAVTPFRSASIASAVSVFQSPTITANGTLIWSSVINFQTVPILANMASLFLEPNQNWLVTFQANQANQPASFHMAWIEA